MRRLVALPLACAMLTLPLTVNAQAPSDPALAREEAIFNNITVNRPVGTNADFPEVFRHRVAAKLARCLDDTAVAVKVDIDPFRAGGRNEMSQGGAVNRMSGTATLIDAKTGATKGKYLIRTTRGAGYEGSGLTRTQKYLSDSMGSELCRRAFQR